MGFEALCDACIHDKGINRQGQLKSPNKIAARRYLYAKCHRLVSDIGLLQYALPLKTDHNRTNASAHLNVIAQCT